MDTSIFGQKITVSDSGMYSATDLIKAGNNWLLKNGKSLFSWHEWRQSNNTREFIVELEKNMVLLLLAEGVEGIIHGFILFYSWIWRWR